MSKYIIKELPCYMNQPEADCWADQLSLCKNYTDCIMKQIIELCKEELKGQYSDAWNLAQKIIKL